LKRACRWITYAIGWHALKDGADRIRHHGGCWENVLSGVLTLALTYASQFLAVYVVAAAAKRAFV